MNPHDPPGESPLLPSRLPESVLPDLEEHPTHQYLRLRGWLTTPGDVAYRWNFRTNRYDYVSPSAASLTGFGSEELLAFTVAEAAALVHEEDCEKVGRTLEGLLQGGSAELEYRIVRKDGAVRWVSDRLHVVTDVEERPRYRVGVLRDAHAAWEQRWAARGRPTREPHAAPRGSARRWGVASHLGALAAGALLAIALPRLAWHPGVLGPTPVPPAALAGVDAGAAAPTPPPLPPTAPLVEAPASSPSAPALAVDPALARLRAERAALRRRVAALERRTPSASAARRPRVIPIAGTASPVSDAAPSAGNGGHHPAPRLRWFQGPPQPIAADPASHR